MRLEDRHALRAEKAAPLVAALPEELLRLQKSVLPKSTLGQAVNYTLALWKKRIRKTNPSLDGCGQA